MEKALAKRKEALQARFQLTGANGKQRPRAASMQPFRRAIEQGLGNTQLRCKAQAQNMLKNKNQLERSLAVRLRSIKRHSIQE
jgi:hypothetical protein